MWSSHPGDDDDDEANDQAAINALAAFQYGAQQQMGTAGYGAVDLQEQYRRQQAMMAYQHGQVAHGYGDLNYSRQFVAQSQAEQRRAWGEEEVDENLEEEEEEEEDDDDSDEEPVNEIPANPPEQAGAVPEINNYGQGMEEEEEDDEEEEGDGDAYDDDDGGSAVRDNNAQPNDVVVPVVRGKPEAMAKALAEKGLQKHMEELEMDNSSHSGDSGGGGPVQDNEEMEEEMDDETSPVKSAAEAAVMMKKTQKSSSSSSSSSKRKMSSSRKPKSPGPSLDDPVSDMTEKEYENVESLMVQFCRVPLLAEFSRPVTLLHPELMPIYSKIVSHPVDLGQVCRNIGRKEYKNTRDIQLHMWRMFSNCVKYHSHPNNKDAVPSFVSIALHLRDYFNALWEEFMIPSNPPSSDDGTTTESSSSPSALQRLAFSKREENRKKRLNVSSLTPISAKCLQKTSEMLERFMETGFCVDDLDQTSYKYSDMASGADERDLRVVMENLNRLRDKLTEIVASSQEYTVEEFEREIKECCNYNNTDLFEKNPSLRVGIGHRIDRLLGKLIVPINEANCRGVTQSSVWGCMAAVIWARESSKKPYWPALVLGILAPEDQREDWHNALTERNEVRLPEKLRTQLTSGKRRAEQALKRQMEGLADPQSFFLVEFLGSHEFIWVRESDIVEEFDPKEDPNTNQASNSKKKRSARANTASVIGSKQYVSAIEEANWALEEFELQLQDPCGDMVDDEEEGEEMNYSYSVLCLSDEEAEEAGKETEEMTLSDLEEVNELLATQGSIDFTTAGRKNAKKRALAMKKQKADAEKKEKAEIAKKAKAEQSKKKKDNVKKEREEKKEQLALEKRRKSRLRNREKALRAEQKKKKRQRTDDPAAVEETTAAAASSSSSKPESEKVDLMFDKRGRATAIVKAYLSRMINKEDYKNLSLNGIMTIPAAMVDSSGLLGMSLAFRAAAGELSMPDDMGDPDAKNRPWEKINAEKPKTSAGRIDRLEKQEALLEKEIQKLQEDIEFRRKKTEEAKIRLQDQEEKTAKNDKVARQNHYKKKKKYVRGGSAANRRTTIETSSTEKNQGVDDHDDDEDAGDTEHVYSVEVVSEEVVEEQSDVDHEDNRSYASDDIDPNEMEETEGMY